MGRWNRLVPYDRKYYVYAWFDKGSKIPCYIGKGCGDRAYRKERAKRRVKLLYQQLTESQALMVEGVLIDTLRSLGVKLLNVGDPQWGRVFCTGELAEESYVGCS